ncbi:MAG: hypothetical protein PHT77_01390 [Bacteroidales bacterium]|nr:hypothetical protein [Bacteroidales bacterium]
MEDYQRVISETIEHGRNLYFKAKAIPELDISFELISKALKQFTKANWHISEDTIEKAKVLCYISDCYIKLNEYLNEDNLKTAYPVAFQADSIFKYLESENEGKVFSPFERTLISPILKECKEKGISYEDCKRFGFNANGVHGPYDIQIDFGGNRPSDFILRSIIEMLINLRKAEFQTQNPNIDVCIYTDLYIAPLIFFWNILDYGTEHDFFEEGDSLMPFIAFNSNRKEALSNIMSTWEIFRVSTLKLDGVSSKMVYEQYILIGRYILNIL